MPSPDADTAVLFRVDAARHQHPGVDHAAAGDLRSSLADPADPARLAARLCRGAPAYMAFIDSPRTAGEREVSGRIRVRRPTPTSRPRTPAPRRAGRPWSGPRPPPGPGSGGAPGCGWRPAPRCGRCARLTTYSGSGLVGIDLICTGEVCVRSACRTCRSCLARGGSAVDEQGVLHLPGGMVQQGCSARRSCTTRPRPRDLPRPRSPSPRTRRKAGRPHRDRIPRAVHTARLSRVTSTVSATRTRRPVGFQLGLPLARRVPRRLRAAPPSCPRFCSGLRRQGSDSGARQGQRRPVAINRDARHLSSSSVVGGGDRRERVCRRACHLLSAALRRWS